MRNNLRGLSPGKEGHTQQVTFNHHPATACKTNYAGVKKKQKNLRQGRWNVNTLYQADNLCNVIKIMRRLKVGIMRIAEVRWTGNGIVSLG